MSSFWFVLSEKKMLYSYSSELNTSIWAITVEQQGCPHVRKAQEARHIS